MFKNTKALLKVVTKWLFVSCDEGEVRVQKGGQERRKSPGEDVARARKELQQFELPYLKVRTKQDDEWIQVGRIRK